MTQVTGRRSNSRHSHRQRLLPPYVARRYAMQTRFAKLSHHPVFPLLALLAANVVFYVSLASTIA